MGCENKKNQYLGLGAPLLSKYSNYAQNFYYMQSYKVKDENSKNME